MRVLRMRTGTHRQGGEDRHTQAGTGEEQGKGGHLEHRQRNTLTQKHGVLGTQAEQIQTNRDTVRERPPEEEVVITDQRL